MAITSIVTESQGMAANMVAESVITSGVKSFGLSPYVQNPQYLRLFEAMLQGMIEYQVSVESWLRVVSGPGLIHFFFAVRRSRTFVWCTLLAAVAPLSRLALACER